MAQESSDRFILEGGIVGGNAKACPAHYAGLSGQVVGAISLYVKIENYRCQDFRGSANRFGASYRIGSPEWLIRPEFSGGVEYDRGDLSPTFAASLLLGRRYGARFSFHIGDVSEAQPITLFQLGGYIRF